MPKPSEPPSRAFTSAAPQVKLVNAFRAPFDNAVATARTCYSSQGIVTAEQVAGGGLDNDARKERLQKRDELAFSIYRAGHHTTLQHAHFQFTLQNVSRQFVWSFLHSHPFYNSEQVSQRYVTVTPGQMAVPPLCGEALRVYREAVLFQAQAYQDLTEKLKPLVEREYRQRFKHANLTGKVALGIVQKKSQEVARYVLPVATFTYLYHTVSALTLFRYWRLCRSFDAPLEQQIVAGKMMEEVLKAVPEFQKILEEPLVFEETTEAVMARGFKAASADHQTFRRKFDASLGGRVSKLADYSKNGEKMLATAVREVFGLPPKKLPDNEAIARVLDPAKNKYLGETLNVTTHSKLSRALFHVHYSFKKKISHTADSQDQRHRMTPASRPILDALSLDEPDYITPLLVLQEPSLEKEYGETMQKTWEAIARLRRLGISDEFAAYLLPNAVAIRFTESADLLNLHHKHAMRLCYNAQEEIWKASLDEAQQISEIHPRIGKWLLPPCGLRFRASAKPTCPEGDRFCGVTVWKKELNDYQRVI